MFLNRLGRKCSVTKALMASWTIGTLLVATALLAALGSTMGMMMTIAVALIVAALQVAWLVRSRHSLDKAIEAIDAAANGDLDQRILHIRGHGRFGALLHGINRLLDLTEVFTKEADAAMAMTAEGR